MDRNLKVKVFKVENHHQVWLRMRKVSRSPAVSLETNKGKRVGWLVGCVFPEFLLIRVFKMEANGSL